MPTDVSVVQGIRPAPAPPTAEQLINERDVIQQAKLKRQALIDGAMDDAAIKTAMQAHGGDLDETLKALGTQRPSAMIKLQPFVDAHREKVATAVKSEIANQTAQDEVTAQWAQTIDSPEKFAAALKIVRPEIAQQLGTAYDPQRIAVLRDQGLKSAEWHKQAAEAIEKAPKTLNDALLFAADHLANAPNQQAWDSVAGYYDALGSKSIAGAIRQQYGQFSPENQAKAAQQALTPDQRADNARQDATQKSTAALQAAQATAAGVNAQANLVRAQKPPAAGSATPAGQGVKDDPDALSYLATQYRVLGAQGIPTRIGESDKVAVIREAAQQAKSLGQSPAVAVQKQAAFKADAAALTQMRKMSSSAEAYENKASAQTKIIEELSPKVDRTFSPMLNGWLLAGKREIQGDSPTAQLFNAIQTFSNEYAKIMEGSTGSVAASSDSARKGAERLISASQNQKTLTDVVGLMKREMKLTLDGYGATIDHITERMGGGKGDTPKPDAAKDPLGIRKGGG